MLKMMKEIGKMVDSFIAICLFIMLISGIMILTPKDDDFTAMTMQEVIEEGTLDHDEMMELLSGIDL